MRKILKKCIRVNTIPLFSEPVTSVTFTRDGQCVLASTLDNSLKLMDKDSGEMLNE